MAAERKRPWYLVLALLGALALGTTAAQRAWGTIMLYREPLDMSQVGSGIGDPGDRETVQKATEAYVRAIDAAKQRGWPIAVGSLLLGGAMVVFAMRALGGSAGARAALLQLVVAQAGLNAASHWLLRDVDDAEVSMGVAHQVAGVHEAIRDRALADDTLQRTAAMAGMINPLRLVLSTLASTLVIVALTRRRARDFFDASAAALEER
jgi:hypothetical protein